MDFFEQQAKAHHKTRILILYFSLAVVSIVLMVYGIAVIVLVGASGHHHHYSDDTPVSVWDPQLFAGVALGTLAVIFLGTAYKTVALSGGGSVVAESLGGRLLSANASDPNERKLLNVVEEMSIASGVPMPKVYVLDHEDGINAFAAGHSTSDAVVAVTRSCMTQLTRDELQGVIGHEFSHILNGDMRLNIRLIGILFGIFCIATIGRILLSTGGRDRNPLPIIGILLLIVGGLGVFFGRLIQAAVSRQREFLADASSVQFTRNPLGLSGALQKIGGSSSRLSSPHASDASHLFFANGLSSFFNFFATHPPIPDRIRAIDKTWNGSFKELRDEPDENLEDSGTRAKSPAPSMPELLQKVPGGAIVTSGGMAEPPVIKPHAVMPNLGNPTALHLKYAEELRNALPENLKAAAHEPLDATALIYALLLSQDDSLRATQITGLAERTPQTVPQKAAALYPDVLKTAARARLPLVNIALPALRQLSADQFRQFSQALQWLIDSDGETELFEFVVQKIVLRHLDSQFNGARKAVVQYYTFKPLVPDAAIILSALANVGSEDGGEIQKAFDTGAPFLRAPVDAGLTLLPAAQCGVEQVDAALNRLAIAAPIIKRNLLEASTHVIGADGLIKEPEAELLRAIADTLDCPMPPLGVSV